MPRVNAGAVLVRVTRSCIPVGTETRGVRTSGMPLWKRAPTQPQNVRKVIRLARSQGLPGPEALSRKLSSGSASGYSSAGPVVEVGSGAAAGVREPASRARALMRLSRGTRGRALNLCVRVPDEVDMDSASTVTLGAIALQGVRRAAPTLGECFVVIGLGAIGQITSQILAANGCRVVGIDPDRERVRESAQPRDGRGNSRRGRLGRRAGAPTHGRPGCGRGDHNSGNAVPRRRFEGVRHVPKERTVGTRRRRRSQPESRGHLREGLDFFVSDILRTRAIRQSLRRRGWIILSATCAGPRTATCRPTSGFWPLGASVCSR